MRRAFWFAGGIGAALTIALLMAPTGGFPSRPRFQSVGIAEIAPSGTGGLAAQRIGVGIGGAPAGAGTIDAAGTITARGDVSLLAASTTNPTVEFNMQDATVNNSRWQVGAQAETFVMRALNDAGSAISRFLEVERTGATIDSVNLLGTAVRANGVPIARVTMATTATSGAGMLKGDTIHVVKGSDTSRSSTTTVTVDPDLQVTALPAGQYLVEMYLDFTPTGVGGFRARGDMSGTGPLDMLGTRVCGTTITAVFGEEANEITCAFTGLIDYYLLLKGSTSKSAATGTVGVFWAQEASAAAATVLESESWLKVTRLN